MGGVYVKCTTNFVESSHLLRWHGLWWFVHPLPFLPSQLPKETSDVLKAVTVEGIARCLK